MKIKETMILTEVGGETLAVPVGEAAKVFQGVIRLNETAVFIWHGIEAGCMPEEIAHSLVENYDGVEESEALRAVNGIIEQIRTAGVLEE